MPRTAPLNPIFQESMRAYAESRKAQGAGSTGPRANHMQVLAKRQADAVEPSPKRAALSPAGFDNRQFLPSVDAKRKDEPGHTPLRFCHGCDAACDREGCDKKREYSCWVGRWGGLRHEITVELGC